MDNLAELYKLGGIVLAFIGFQGWMLKYFMKQINGFQNERKELLRLFSEALEQHCSIVSASLVAQAKSFDILIQKIDEIIRLFERTSK